MTKPPWVVPVTVPVILMLLPNGILMLTKYPDILPPLPILEFPHRASSPKKVPAACGALNYTEAVASTSM